MNCIYSKASGGIFRRRPWFFRHCLGNGLDGGVKRADRIDGAGLVGFIRAFYETAEDVARTAFDEQFGLGHEFAQAGFPTDGATNLLAEIFADFGRCFNEIAREVLRDRAGRFGE